MPELPEVEVVRRGLAEHLVGRTIVAVSVLHDRPVRRHLPGPRDFESRLIGAGVLGAHRRGKYLWVVLSTGEVLFAHLGMSGQFLVRTPGDPVERNLRVVLDLDDGSELRYVDQRMFGGLWLGDPEEIAHIAPDPVDPAFDDADFVARLRAKQTNVKRALLDQRLISGVGNIYADEALWRARLHYARPTATLRRTEAAGLLQAVREVLADALHAGGTSFDSLYVNVNGESGYFDRSLAVYGREDQPCPRCGTPIRRDPFMNRSSYSCLRCQPRPRNAHW